LTQKNIELAKKVDSGASGGKKLHHQDARSDVNGTPGGDAQFVEKKLDYKDPASFFRSTAPRLERWRSCNWER
jgi:conjugal transfer pilus assembly protein TraB